MNLRNFTHGSNFFFGTTLFGEETLYAVQKCNLPGLGFSHINANRQSAQLFIQGDTLTFNDLNIDIIIDEELITWIDIVSTLLDMRNPENGESKQFGDRAWLEIHDDNTNKVLKLDFYGSIIESIGDLDFTTTEEDEVLTVGIVIKYDYYKLERTQKIENRKDTKTDITHISKDFCSNSPKASNEVPAQLR